MRQAVADRQQRGKPSSLVPTGFGTGRHSTQGWRRNSQAPARRTAIRQTIAPAEMVTALRSLDRALEFGQARRGGDRLLQAFQLSAANAGHCHAKRNANEE